MLFLPNDLQGRMGLPRNAKQMMAIHQTKKTCLAAAGTEVNSVTAKASDWWH
jgi:hypothetical protein